MYVTDVRTPFAVRNPSQSSPILTILVPFWFIITSLVFLYLSEILFSHFTKTIARFQTKPYDLDESRHLKDLSIVSGLLSPVPLFHFCNLDVLFLQCCTQLGVRCRCISQAVQPKMEDRRQIKMRYTIVAQSNHYMVDTERKGSEKTCEENTLKKTRISFSIG